MTTFDKTVLVIGGPTASGKSSLALAIANKLGGTVINADSMQVYEGLPILTAQPDADELVQAPHKLYSVLDPSEGCSAAHWRELALAEIEAAKGLPIVVGGTGFYLQSLMQGLSQIPDIPAEVRAKGVALQAELSNPGFHAELTKLDPVMAERLDPNDTQRLIRAWEVLEHTGRSLALWQNEPKIGAPEHLQFVTVALLPERHKLYEVCDRRFGVMLERGALDEVRAFKARIEAGEVPQDAQLCHALGYRELVAYLDGEWGLEQAREVSCQQTRNYAKRQVTWFKNQLQADLILKDVSPKSVESVMELF